MIAGHAREQLSYGLGRLAALARQRDWVTGAAGLTPTQGDTLRLLADRAAGLRLGELAAHLSVRPSTASDVVAVLVAKETVQRLPDPDIEPDQTRRAFVRTDPAPLRRHD